MESMSMSDLRKANRDLAETVQELAARLDKVERGVKSWLKARKSYLKEETLTEMIQEVALATLEAVEDADSDSDEEASDAESDGDGEDGASDGEKEETDDGDEPEKSVEDARKSRKRPRHQKMETD